VALPKKTVDYFPHTTKHGQTMFIIENKYGNDGYSFWFKLLEILGSTEGHYIDISKIDVYEFLLAKTRISDTLCQQILQTLVNLEAIDPELYQVKIIWCQKFINGIADAYSRRTDKLPNRNAVFSLYANRNGNNVDIINDSVGILPEKNRKEKRKGKEKERDTDNILYAEIILDFNEVTNSHYKTDPVTKDIVQLINSRMKEGFTLEDFKKVHRNKFTSWGNDPKMKKFLRPHTLYTGKFQAYLNEQNNPIVNDERRMELQKELRNAEKLLEYASTPEIKERQKKEIEKLNKELGINV
jgi:uncharacterized phage protein (TIGR02220 family)